MFFNKQNTTDIKDCKMIPLGEVPSTKCRTYILVYCTNKELLVYEEL